LTWASFAFRPDAGISTAGFSIRTALRMRVSISANGSVIIGGVFLPTGLADAGDQTVERHAPEANSANAKLAVHGPRPATDLAPHPDADQVPRP
jgi:hypothetical protein